MQQDNVVSGLICKTGQVNNLFVMIVAVVEDVQNSKTIECISYLFPLSVVSNCTVMTTDHCVAVISDKLSALTSLAGLVATIPLSV